MHPKKQKWRVKAPTAALTMFLVPAFGASADERMYLFNLAREIKFSSPHCDQHLHAAKTQAGRQLQDPSAVISFKSRRFREIRPNPHRNPVKRGICSFFPQHHCRQ
jgi:hypothetical protein